MGAGLLVGLFAMAFFTGILADLDCPLAALVAVLLAVGGCAGGGWAFILASVALATVLGVMVAASGSSDSPRIVSA